MNIAVAYRFTGEDPIDLEKVLGSVCSSLRRGGHDVFCSIEKEPEFRQQGYSADQIYSICREEFKKREAIFVFLSSGARSKGIELELDDATSSRKPIFLATPRNVLLYREKARKIIEYDDVGSLCCILHNYQFKSS